MQRKSLMHWKKAWVLRPSDRRCMEFLLQGRRCIEFPVRKSGASFRSSMWRFLGRKVGFMSISAGGRHFSTNKEFPEEAKSFAPETSENRGKLNRSL
ncbi:hypothetical protein NDU88_008182 [Pleurodeles waltl]|uniref:Uncharacterized protein n=1 Tax=Pleurodeles waltl TaxID=8319 RepID=A0AAV7QN02_PLEWA|nr:hypothetical protein NDU88_008182 [Pleurodeles waltl]